MSKQIDALKMALEALELDSFYGTKKQEAITAIKEALAQKSNEQVEPVARAWSEGYLQGVEDERTSEANIGIAGFGAKVEPARENPYTHPPVPTAMQMDVIVVNLVREGINKHLARELAEHFIKNATSPVPTAQPKQCWKCGDMDAEFQAKCNVPACGMKEPEQEPVASVYEIREGTSFTLVYAEAVHKYNMVSEDAIVQSFYTHPPVPTAQPKEPEQEPVACTDVMCACRGGSCVSCPDGEHEKAQLEQKPALGMKHSVMYSNYKD